MWMTRGFNLKYFKLRNHDEILMQPSMGILTLPCPRLHLYSYSPFVMKFHGQDSPTIHLHWYKIRSRFTLRCNLLVQDSPSLYYVFRRRFTHCIIQLAWLGKDSPYPTERYGADSLRPKIYKVKIHPTCDFL